MSHVRAISCFLALVALGFLWLRHTPAPPPATRVPLSPAQPPLHIAKSSLSREASGNTSADDASAAEMAAAASRRQLVDTIAASLRAWEDNDDPDKRDERIASLDRLISDNGQRPMAERLDLIAALPPSLMDFAFGLPSFQQWMLAEPVAALDWMRLHPAIADARVLTVFQHWMEHDPEQLRHYIAELPDSEWKQHALSAASYAVLPSDPSTALGWAKQMQPGASRLGLLDLATTEWARRDPLAASRWLGDAGDFGLREQLTGALAVGFADSDPITAAQCVLSSLPSGRVLDRSIAERTKDSEVTYSVANRIWAQRGLTLKPEFLDAMVEHFGAPVVGSTNASNSLPQLLQAYSKIGITR